MHTPLVQTKLTINQPGDKYEQEADLVADQVMRMSDPGQSIQKKCAECKKEDEEKLQRKPLISSITPVMQRQSENEEDYEEMLQMKADSPGTSSQVTPLFQSSLNSVLNTGGRPLSQTDRAFFEPRFGADFSHVRIHDNTQAAIAARQINARAFTFGSDIYFNHGEYNTSSQEGTRLLGHELTHSLQQSGNTKRKTIPVIQRSFLGNLIAGGVGALAGGYLGYKIGGETGAFIGGLAGVGLGMAGKWLYNRLTNSNKNQKKEKSKKPYANCPDNIRTLLESNRGPALNRIKAALDIMRVNPTSRFVENVLWLNFRTNTKEAKDLIIRRLIKIANGFNSIKFICESLSEKSHCTEEPDTAAYSFEESDPITICIEKFQKSYAKNQDRYGTDMLIIHESAHIFNPEVKDYGYFRDDCKESHYGLKPTEGDPPKERLDNADSYACLVKQLSDPTINSKIKSFQYKDNIANRADKYRGIDLIISWDQAAVGDRPIDLYPGSVQELDEFNFHLEYDSIGNRNLPPASGFSCRWTLNFGKSVPSVGLEDQNCHVSLRPILDKLRNEKITTATLECEVDLYRGYSQNHSPISLSKDLTFNHKTPL